MRPPDGPARAATVIVRILPQHRRKGLGTEYLRRELDAALALGARRIETVVLASNADSLAFASAHGFVEHDRYVLPGHSVAFVDMHLDVGLAVAPASNPARPGSLSASDGTRASAVELGQFSWTRH